VGPTLVKRILLVDDDRVTLDAVGRLLESHGYHAARCPDSTEAVTRALKEPWDLIILDLGLPSPSPTLLPDFGGLKVLGWLARMNRTAPVIVFTGNGADDAEQKAMAAGAFAVVRKSEPPYRLVETVQLALKVGLVGRSLAPAGN
jgi:CheY-like chemotaxis protein